MLRVLACFFLVSLGACNVVLQDRVVPTLSALGDTESTNSSVSKNSSEPISVSVVTWNFAEKCPSEHDAAFLKDLRGRDLIVLGVQECEDIKPRRHEGHRSRAWRALQKKVFGKQYKCLAQHKMGGLQLAVYGSKRFAKQVQGMQVLDVACGVGNVLTNKGGICVLLRIRGKTLALINGHFAAHQTKVAERNADFDRILKSVTSRANPRWLLRELAAKRKKALKAAKASGGEPWLEQMFQFAGMPEDRGFERRVRPVRLAPPALTPDLDADDCDDSRRRTKSSKTARKGKGKRKFGGKGIGKGKRRLGKPPLSSLLPDGLLGLTGKAAKPKGPIVPGKKTRGVDGEGGRGGRVAGTRPRRGVADNGDDSDEEAERFTGAGAGDGAGLKLLNAEGLPSLLGALGDSLSSPFRPKAYGSTAVSASGAAALTSASPSDAYGPKARDVRPVLEDVPFDAIIFLGDLNYRVDLPRLDVEQYRETHFPSSLAPFPTAAPNEHIVNVAGLETGALDRLRLLLAHDQLERERRLGRVFRGFREGRVSFLPSFKYDKGSARFDSSPKARCPAWTDRVLFAVAGGEGVCVDDWLRHPSGSPALKLEDYFSVDARHSDHRPVAASMSLEI